MQHISYYLYYDYAVCRESHNIVCSAANIYNMQKTVWLNVFIRTRDKIKKQSFSVLAEHGFC